MVTASGNLLERIVNSMETFSRSEKKIAALVLDDPQQATRSSIARLAKMADVSEPTVNRLCKKLGATGYTEFKLQLAQSLASGVRYLSQDVEPDDDEETYTRKIFDSTTNSLNDVKDKLSPNLVSQVVDKLIQARRIFFFGLGASSAVAKDAEHKFFRFNLPVSFYEDVLMQRMLASTGVTGDVFFFISYTGRTRELVDTARLAKETGATLIGLTAPGSPLAKICNLVIEIEVSENTDEYMPMTSRLVHLVVLDVLATGVTLRRGPEFQPFLKKIKESLKPTRYPMDDEAGNSE